MKGDLTKGLKIIDFGIAGKIQLSFEKHKAGTFKYCPPELLSAESFYADPAFDVWSIGILLFKLVFGCFPFEGENWKETKQKIIEAKLIFPGGPEHS